MVFIQGSSFGLCESLGSMITMTLYSTSTLQVYPVETILCTGPGRRTRLGKYPAKTLPDVICGSRNPEHA